MSLTGLFISREGANGLPQPPFLRGDQGGIGEVGGGGEGKGKKFFIWKEEQLIVLDI